MGLDIAGCVNRIAALEKEAMLALATPKSCDAFPYYWQTNAPFPYWTNRIGSVSLETGAGGDEDDGEEEETAQYDIIMRLVVKHVSAGTQGENEDDLATYIPHIIDYFNARELLQQESGAFAAPPSDLIRARIISCTGTTVFTELGVWQLGTEFTLRMEFEQYVEQAYL